MLVVICEHQIKLNVSTNFHINQLRVRPEEFMSKVEPQFAANSVFI